MARILLIDDEPAFLQALCRMLAGEAHIAVPVEQGATVADALAAGVYDAVVTDLRMQGMDGWTVAAWLRRHRPRTPIIAISGDTSGGAENQPMGVFDLVLAKPLRKATFLQAIEAVLASPG